MAASPALTPVTPILNPAMNPPIMQPYTHSQAIARFLPPFSFPDDKTRALEGDFFRPSSLKQIAEHIRKASVRKRTDLIITEKKQPSSTLVKKT
jgi:hypothetical protein